MPRWKTKDAAASAKRRSFVQPMYALPVEICRKAGLYGLALAKNGSTTASRT
jgi:hypothetical protein